MYSRLLRLLLTSESTAKAHVVILTKRCHGSSGDINPCVAFGSGTKGVQVCLRLKWCQCEKRYF